MYTRREAPKQEQDAGDCAEERPWERLSADVPPFPPPILPSVHVGGGVPGPPTYRPQQVDPSIAMDPVCVYLLARGQVCRCLQWATCHNHPHHPYLWLWPPFMPPPNPFRLHLPNPRQHTGGMAAWRHGFAVDSHLSPRDVWPPHLQRLAPGAPSTGDYWRSSPRVACT